MGAAAMDGLSQLLITIRDEKLAVGRLAGLFHLLISDTIADQTGAIIGNGLTWRQLAQALKEARFDKGLVEEIGADPATLSPRNRERFWNIAIGLAMASGTGPAQAEQLIRALKAHGYSRVKRDSAARS
jgi:hypothetical protein